MFTVCNIQQRTIMFIGQGARFDCYHVQFRIESGSEGSITPSPISIRNMFFFIAKN